MQAWVQGFKQASQRFWQQLAAELEGGAALAAGPQRGDWSDVAAVAASVQAPAVARVQDAPRDTAAVRSAQPVVHGSHQPVPAAVAQPLLQIQDVSLVYRTAQQQVQATHRVSLDVYEGDRFVLLGASGCGKSSLLKALGGFFPPSEGQILLDGQRVQGRDAVKEYLRNNPEVCDKIEQEIRANSFKLMSPQARKAAQVSGRAVDITASDFDEG